MTSASSNKWSVSSNELSLFEWAQAQLVKGPLFIRVLCPRGHFISDVSLTVPDGGNIWIYPQDAEGNYGPNLSPENQGLVMNWHHPSQSTNMIATCMRPKCAYRGNFNQFKLALDLAVAAIAGHTEHRLTV